MLKKQSPMPGPEKNAQNQSQPVMKMTKIMAFLSHSGIKMASFLKKDAFWNGNLSYNNLIHILNCFKREN